MGRGFGDYNRISYELWDARASQQPSHPAFDLSAMINAYDSEAAQTLNAVLCAMETKWPKTVSPSDSFGAQVGNTSAALAVATPSPGIRIVINAPPAPGTGAT
jgi:hypothetical protein